MPTQTDTPIGIGALSDWQLGAGTSKVSAVETNDGETSFVYASSGGAVRSQLYTFPTLAGISDPVASAALTMSARKSLNGTGGQSFYSVWNSVVGLTNQWGNLPLDYTFGPTGETFGTPTLAAVNGQHGFYMSAAGGPSGAAEIWVSYFIRVIGFTFADVDSTGFAYLVGSILAAIGPMLMRREMPALARELRKTRGLAIHPHELDEAYQRFRALTFPRHFVLGA